MSADLEINVHQVPFSYEVISIHIKKQGVFCVTSLPFLLLPQASQTSE